MRETIEDVLRGIIANQAHLDPSAITRESVLSELGVTSLDLVEIIMTIEDKYRRKHTGGCGRSLERLQDCREPSRAGSLARP